MKINGFRTVVLLTLLSMAGSLRADVRSVSIGVNGVTCVT